MGGVHGFLSPPCMTVVVPNLCARDRSQRLGTDTVIQGGKRNLLLLLLHTSSQLFSPALTEKSKHSPDYQRQLFTRGQQCHAVCTWLLLCVCWHVPSHPDLRDLAVFVQHCPVLSRSSPCQGGGWAPSLPSSSGREQLWAGMVVHRHAADVELA